MSDPVQVIRTRRRTIALIVHEDGSLTIRAPLRAPEKLIREFVESKTGWIKKKQAQAKAAVRLTVKQYIAGEKFWYLGKLYPLVIVAHQRPALELGAAFRLAKSAQPKGERAFVRWYKEQARRLLAERLTRYAERYGFTFQKIRITSARTRWGSCSTRGVLSFTYRLVMAPIEVMDYVVVHELVHLKVKNHSKTFWAQVQAILPDYKLRLTWLKKNGRFLTLGK